jgi:hypothetical protein
VPAQAEHLTSLGASFDFKFFMAIIFGDNIVMHAPVIFVITPDLSYRSAFVRADAYAVG